MVEPDPTHHVGGCHLARSGSTAMTHSHAEATRNKCIASSNKCLTSSNKKLVETSALLVVTGACHMTGSLEKTHPVDATDGVWRMNTVHRRTPSTAGSPGRTAQLRPFGDGEARMDARRDKVKEPCIGSSLAVTGS